MAGAKTERFSNWLKMRRGGVILRMTRASLSGQYHEDLSDIEEEKDRSFIVAVGVQAAANAINEI